MSTADSNRQSTNKCGVLQQKSAVVQHVDEKLQTAYVSIYTRTQKIGFSRIIRARINRKIRVTKITGAKNMYLGLGIPNLKLVFRFENV